MKKKSTSLPADVGGKQGREAGAGSVAAEPRAEENERTGGSRDSCDGSPGSNSRNRDSGFTAADPSAPDDAGKPAAGGAAFPLFGDAAGTEVSGDEVFRDIIRKAVRGEIKYQELYLKYIDLISGRMIDEDEVVYEATFIDDQDKET